MRNGEFVALLREYAGLLTHIAASYEADPALRDDLLQDIALALWRAAPAWRGEASMKTFVARVAHNRGVTHLIRRKRRGYTQPLEEGLADEAPSPESNAQRGQRHRQLLEAVRSLPLSLRQVVTLALEGFTQREIAEAVGITANNVAVRLNRARRALKSRLGERP